MDSMFQSMDDNIRIKDFTWRIENLSTIKYKKLYSETFIVDGNKWRVLIFPKGNNVDYLSIYISVADSANLHSGWSRYAQFGFNIIKQFDFRTSCKSVAAHEFNAKEPTGGYTSFLALSELHNPEIGYLVNDACLLEVYVSTDGTEVMRTFFTRLESKLLSSNIVVPQYKAKEAITKLDEAFNMTPVSSYDSEKISSLKKASMILASSDFSSTMLTIEEKNELMSMEERLIELANRATKAQQDKHYFTEKKWMKLTITGKLDRNLIKYKKIESEVKLMQEKMVSLMAELKGFFKSSKEMKTELETLEKECVEYDTKAKIADEEVKIVEAEWRRMKDFISCLG